MEAGRPATGTKLVTRFQFGELEFGRGGERTGVTGREAGARSGHRTLRTLPVTVTYTTGECWNYLLMI